MVGVPKEKKAERDATARGKRPFEAARKELSPETRGWLAGKGRRRTRLSDEYADTALPIKE